MLYVLGAIGNFVVDLFNFEGEVKFLGMLCVFFEKRVTFGFQVVAFFLPDTRNCQHVIGLSSSVHPFLVCRYSGEMNWFDAWTAGRRQRGAGEGLEWARRAAPLRFVGLDDGFWD
jgi:hypothetical protein